MGTIILNSAIAVFIGWVVRGVFEKNNRKATYGRD